MDTSWIVVIIVTMVVGIGVYFLPSIIARNDEHFRKIFFLNLLGAWTGILWVAALGWALMYRNPKSSVAEQKEREILRLVQQKGGKITPFEIAAETKMSLDESKSELDRLCETGLAEVHLTEDGNLIYSFQGIVSQIEKTKSRSPLDM